MKLNTLFMPYDLYERHSVVGRLLTDFLGIEKSQVMVLDVGGRAELLKQFLPNQSEQAGQRYQVTSINPDGTGDLIASGTAIPFKDGAFDVIVTIDTLEHLPQEERLPFLEECLQVARRGVIMAAPYGGEAHIAFERQLLERYQDVFGETHLYLSEHVEYGLPGPADLDRYEQAHKDVKVSRYYAGDYVWQGATFERGVLANTKKGITKKALNLYNQISSMALFHRVRLLREPVQTTNRFYLVFDKTSSA